MNNESVKSVQKSFSAKNRKRGNTVTALTSAIEIGEAIYSPNGKVKIVFRLARIGLELFR